VDSLTGRKGRRRVLCPKSATPLEISFKGKYSKFYLILLQLTFLPHEEL